MSGILFLATRQLETIVEFYTERLGCRAWLDQPDCHILKHGNQLLGFCARDRADIQGILTFFYPGPDEVDDCYRRLKDTATGMPEHSDRYRIYRFFGKDPEGRTLEFQSFDHRVNCHVDGKELLIGRRSVRAFAPDALPAALLADIFELCRHAPTSQNSQSYYFRLVNERATLSWLAGLRGPSSAPLAAAPLAAAVCSDPGLTKRPEQDACIAAYHLLLAAWYHGVGSCWIADMNREEVKARLGIPRLHHVATITPLGFPLTEATPAPERRDRQWFLREPTEAGD